MRQYDRSCGVIVDRCFVWETRRKWKNRLVQCACAARILYVITGVSTGGFMMSSRRLTV
jgi:hypothetical protein